MTISNAAPLPGVPLTLPFYAWPLAWRLGGWAIVAVGVAVAVHAGCARLGDDASARGADDEAALLARIAAAERRVETLPGLRTRAAAMFPEPRAKRQAPARGIDASRGAGAPSDAARRDASGDDFSAALLGWIEQSVLASRVRLLAFEPIAMTGERTLERTSWGAGDPGGAVTGAGVDDVDAHAPNADDPAADATPGDGPGAHPDGGEREAARAPNGAGVSPWDRQAPTRTAEPAEPSRAMTLRGRAARLQVQGNYAQVRALLDRLARTRPALLIDAATLTATGGTLSSTLRFRAIDVGDFALRPAPTRRPGEAPAPNPFARRRLPDATTAARLLGTLVAGRRRAALLALAQDTRFVEIGATVGDARVQAIGRDSTTLVPLVEGLPRTLRIGE